MKDYALQDFNSQIVIRFPDPCCDRESLAGESSSSQSPASRGREAPNPTPARSSGASLILFWVLWVLSNLLSVGLGMALSAFIGGGA